MDNIAIKVENLSKIYRLGEIGTGTISRDMERWFKTKVLKQEDPFLKIGESNDRSKKGSSDIVYSLQNINIEIQQGDAVGIIGRNGAGKSTLLKILSRVTTPTTGKINIKGRVASLLEVGTGFHPELTGRENIYLNGAILGMRKREIKCKLDEIIDFSGVERYIDTPVKRYSSGMYVRLAFAVAAHLESEILIVDEVLAVGDSEFQKRCLGKMGEISDEGGRTLLFVSHNMAAIKSLCNNSLILKDGSMSYYGNSKDAIIEYYSLLDEGSGLRSKLTVQNIDRTKSVHFVLIELTCITNPSRLSRYDINDKLQLQLEVFVEQDGLDFIPVLDLIKDGIVLYRSYGSDSQIQPLEYKYKKGSYTFKTEILSPLKKGKYQIDLKLGKVMIEDFDTIQNAIQFEIDEIETSAIYKSYWHERPGLIATEFKWSVIKK